MGSAKKQKLYGDDSYPGHLKRQLLARDRGPVAVVGGRVAISRGKGESHVVHPGVNCVCNSCGSAYS